MEASVEHLFSYAKISTEKFIKNYWDVGATGLIAATAAYYLDRTTALIIADLALMSGGLGAMTWAGYKSNAIRVFQDSCGYVIGTYLSQFAQGQFPRGFLSEFQWGEFLFSIAALAMASYGRETNNANSNQLENLV
ncbi:hypothetical protein HYV81_05895 [Candidatus Woesearchaeota archaeon]|nr:hypothetical protein [Candidatus Woesearchaeota archaeon]